MVVVVKQEEVEEDDSLEERVSSSSSGGKDNNIVTAGRLDLGGKWGRYVLVLALLRELDEESMLRVKTEVDRRVAASSRGVAGA